MNLRDLIRQIEQLGYSDEDAAARVCQDNVYKNTVDKSDKRWLDEDIDVIFSRILEFIASMK